MEKTEGVHSHAPLNTVFGFIAIACWSSTIAFTRTASEFLGPVTMGAFMFLVAGVAGCALLALQRGGLVSALKLPPAYLLGCGALFVCCELGLCLAVGRAVTRQQVLEVSVINYLWPGLTLLFSVWILKRRARLWLMPGVVIALTGVLLAMRNGRIILVAAFSYLTPVLSMFVSSLRLGIRPGLTLWVACAMVVVGAVVCKLSISDD